MNNRETMKYLRGWRYQQTAKEIERLTALAAAIKTELIENHQDPEAALAFDYINGAEVKHERGTLQDS